RRAPELFVGVAKDLPRSGDVEQLRAGHDEKPDTFPRATHDGRLSRRGLKCNLHALSARVAIPPRAAAEAARAWGADEWTVQVLDDYQSAYSRHRAAGLPAGDG